MPHDHMPSPPHDVPRWIYAVIGTVLVVLAIWGVVEYRGHKETEQAQELAAELNQRLDEAGLRTFDEEDIARLLGTDGGAVCDTSSEELAQGFLRLQLSNGAAGPGQRPVRVDQRVVQGELAIIQTYCPDKVEDFEDFVDDLDFDDVIRE
ncbi:MAG TPA: hypothetical protein VH968_01475 [Gaiellaceae bacterium]|jgi:hypothetical protein